MPEPFSEQNVPHSWELQFCQRIVPLLAALGVQRLHANKMGRIDRTAELPHTWALGWREGKNDHRPSVSPRDIRADDIFW